MGTFHDLTLQTATAVGRLAELQRRLDRLRDKQPSVTRAAIEELSTALEELRVANELLESQVMDLQAMRTESQRARSAIDEFAEILPVATLWTDHGGVIERGNDAACQMLNFKKDNLAGKPLMLFITDRAVLLEALRHLYEADGVAGVDLEVVVRPPERSPRRMMLAGRRLRHEKACLWFFHRSAASNAANHPSLAASA
jgi:PAS domain-containing protein